jgi:concanavalin A-like lectin/glucanase superfamily protein
MHVVAAIAGAALLSSVAAHSAAGQSGPARVGEWRFDEDAGQSAIDSGPYALDGRLGATPERDGADPARIAGALGGALRFQGGSFVGLPDASQLAVPTLTAEAVVRAPASPGSFRYVVSRGGDACFAGSYGLYTGAAAGMAIYVFDGTRFVVSPTARPADVWDGRWHHVAGTFDGRTLRLFLDGRPVGEPFDMPMRIDYASTSARAYIGQYAGTCDLAFNGDLDLVRLWSGALSADAVAAAARVESEAGGGAPVSPDLTPLPAAAGATIIPGSRPATETPGAVAPAAPPPACVVRASRKRIVARRRTVVRVRARLRGHPLRATRVIARWSRKERALTAARTGASGRAHLVLRVRRAGKMRISAARKRPSCAPAYIRVTRSR